MDNEDANDTICRVCRCEGTLDYPLFHPCICTGSIKWIHQDCLLLWMSYSQKNTCELCSHPFSFAPVYASSMPKRLPLRDVFGELFNIIMNGTQLWIRCMIVMLCWLGLVPLIAINVHRALFSEHRNFSAKVYELMTIPLRLLIIKEDFVTSILQGILIVLIISAALVGVIWLRDQILIDNGPDWNNSSNVPVNGPPGGGGNEQGQLENNEVEGELDNWNLNELERAVEEITWERLLGFDGTYFFLQPVFCVIPFSCISTIVFAFFPYQVGLYFAEMLTISQYAHAIRLEGIVCTFLGYIVIGFLFYLASMLASRFSLEKFRRFAKITSIIIKASMLFLLELTTLPVIGGWWMDLCSLNIFSGTLSDRLSAFVDSPAESTFVHWIAGMIFAYYFTTFIELLREFLKPGILRFLLPLNCPDFTQGVIRMPLYMHVIQLMILGIISGITVVLLLFVPGCILRLLAPTLLPYPVYDNLWNFYEFSRLLFLLLPVLMDETRLRVWFAFIIRKWGGAVEKLLNLQSFILRNIEQEIEDERAEIQRLVELELGDAQDPIEREVRLPPEPERPNYFWIRCFMLLVLFGATLVASSLIVLTLPVFLKKLVTTLWSSSSESSQVRWITGSYEFIYKPRSSLYSFLLSVEIYGVVRSLRLPHGMEAIESLRSLTMILIKTLIVSFCYLVIIPVLLGILSELMLVIPLRASIGQTAMMDLSSAWAIGFLPMNIAIVLIMVGPDSRLRRSVDRIFHNGFRRIDLKLSVVNTAIPISLMLCIMIGVPYVIAYSVIPFIVRDFKTRCLIARRIYPIEFFMICTATVISTLIRRFVHFYDRLKKDRYLIGRRLVNYNHAT